MTQVDWITLAITVTFFSILLIRFRVRLASFFIKKADLVRTDHEERLHKEVFDKVMILLEEEKFYLNKNIKVSDMAKELHFNDKMVSKAINRYGSGNFNSLINTFRIDHAKYLFNSGDYDHYTVEAIAKDSGFSNKVSFYNAFKSDTGMSPKQFKALKQP